jgi:hypothetical protein
MSTMISPTHQLAKIIVRIPAITMMPPTDMPAIPLRRSGVAICSSPLSASPRLCRSGLSLLQRAAVANSCVWFTPPPGHALLEEDDLEEIRAATEQLHPERARSCRNAITMASVMVDEIRLRAPARPLDEPGQ